MGTIYVIFNLKALNYLRFDLYLHKFANQNNNNSSVTNYENKNNAFGTYID